MVLEDAKPTISFAKRQSVEQSTTQEKKVLYIRMLKVLKWTDTHTESQEDITTTVQASNAGSKLLITLSAMGFISTIYSENRSSEQPTATPSQIKDKFMEGRKDLTNPKA